MTNDELNKNTQQQEVSEETKPQMDPKLAGFIKKHHARFAMFAKANGHVRFPVIMGADGEYKWVSRKDRRKRLK